MQTRVMCGTRLNGLHLGQGLVRYGHNVTIINRGVTEAPIPREVRRLYADTVERLTKEGIFPKPTYG